MVENVVGNANRVEAEKSLVLGRVQVVRKSWNAPIDVAGTAESHHLELALLPRGQQARGCFTEHWGPHRFEPIGQLFLMPAQQAVRAQSDCRQQSSIVCSYDPPAVAQWMSADLQWTDNRLRSSLNLANAPLRSLLFRIGEELRNPGFASEILLELLAAEAAIELSRHLLGICDCAANGGLAPWRLRLIDERLASTDAPPTLSELAEMCNLSVRQLTRGFRSSRGVSIGHYIAERRIDQAKQLLAAGMSVKSVAYSTGFTAPSNFAAAFLRATGETPRQFKERNGRKTTTPQSQRLH
jgi:AraC family transcriptional regulator